ncbi:MAG: type II toxin-antitoxin system HicB family antitoxin [Thermosynechococcaceae cyanobacterium]
MLSYKGYTAKLEVDENSGAIGGMVLDMKGTIHFEGKTVAEATQAFHDSVDDYLAFCKALGREPEKQYSGNFSTRTTPELHRLAISQAQTLGTSLNGYVEALIAKDTQTLKKQISVS